MHAPSAFTLVAFSVALAMYSTGDIFTVIYIAIAIGMLYHMGS